MALCAGAAQFDQSLSHELLLLRAREARNPDIPFANGVRP